MEEKILGMALRNCKLELTSQGGQASKKNKGKERKEDSGILTMLRPEQVSQEVAHGWSIWAWWQWVRRQGHIYLF